MALNLNYEPNVLVENTDAITREEWLKWRAMGIGGSDVAAALGFSPYKTRRDLYYEKSGIEPAISDEENNWVAKEVGKRLESLVADIYQRKTGYKVYPIHKLFQHPIYPFLTANVDFFVQKPNGSRGILETKTSHHQNREKWANDSIPRHYEYQGRHYDCVTNLDFAAFACLFSNSEDDFVMREVERDLDDEENTVMELSHFWNNYVLARVEPPYTEKPDLALESIRRFHGQADASLPDIHIGATFAPALEQFLAFRDEKADLERSARELESKMKGLYVPIVDQLGQCVSGVCESGADKYEFWYKPSGRTSIKKESLEKLRMEYPDIYAEYVSTSDTRSFSVKKIAV